MSHLKCFLFLAACAAAMPSQSSDRMNIVFSRDVNGMNAAIATCEAAENCELYTDQFGDLRVRFKQGMGPGTAAYDNRMFKRDAPANTHITYGDSKGIWGCDVNPVDIFSKITTPCPPGSAACDPGPIDTPIHYLEPGNGYGEPSPEVISFTATGNYPVWAESAFTSALIAAGSQGITGQNGVTWASTPPNGDHWGQGSQSTGTCNIATQTDFVDIATFIGNSLEGHIGIKVTFPTIKDGFCDDTTPESLGAAVSGALPVIGPAIAAILGVITTVCQAISSPSS